MEIGAHALRGTDREGGAIPQSMRRRFRNAPDAARGLFKVPRVIG